VVPPRKPARAGIEKPDGVRGLRQNADAFRQWLVSRISTEVRQRGIHEEGVGSPEPFRRGLTLMEIQAAAVPKATVRLPFPRPRPRADRRTAWGPERQPGYPRARHAFLFARRRPRFRNRGWRRCQNAEVSSAFWHLEKPPSYRVIVRGARNETVAAPSAAPPSPQAGPERIEPDAATRESHP